MVFVSEVEIFFLDPDPSLKSWNRGANGVGTKK